MPEMGTGTGEPMPLVVTPLPHPFQLRVTEDAIRVGLLWSLAPASPAVADAGTPFEEPEMGEIRLWPRFTLLADPSARSAQIVTGETLSAGDAPSPQG